MRELATLLIFLITFFARAATQNASTVSTTTIAAKTRTERSVSAQRPSVPVKVAKKRRGRR